MGLLDRARELRAMIEAMATGLDDETAIDYSELFPEWNPDEHDYNAGDRVRYFGTLYKVLQGHTSQYGWNPTDAPSLFAEVLPGQDGTDIGEWVQPDSTNGYSIGDRVIYKGIIYESLIDNNVWSPEVYPAGWQVING